MKLKDLLEKHEFDSVWPAIETIYPDSQEIAYRQAWNELKGLSPKEPDDNPDMMITVRTIRAEDDELSDKDYVDVSGISKSSEYGNQPMWALDFCPWEEWLYMKVDYGSIEEFSETVVLAHILWEMTFHGFSNESVKETRREVVENTEVVKKLIEEGKLDDFEEWDPEDI
jgi:hypothetical protein